MTAQNPRERTLYVVTRRDLAPSTRAVMAVHVAANAGFRLAPDMLDRAEEWTDDGPPVVLMTVRNRRRLERLAAEHRCLAYVDPDLNEGVCAIALYEYHWNHAWARMAEFS